MSLEYTPIDQIANKVTKLRQSFNDGRLSSIESRRDQLRNLYFAIKDNEDFLKKAIKQDLNKSDGEFQLQELNTFYSDIITIIDNLDSYTKPRNPSQTPLLFKFSSPKIIPTPLGVVLIIGAFNYPLSLALQPLIAAIGAGNTVLLKQSELVPTFTTVLTDILLDSIDPNVLQIVNGGVEETTEVLNHKFDKIMYTGSGTVGKIIAKKAAETLTPVLLELGGKNPAFITENAGDLDIVAKRLVSTKFTNAGQLCVTVDYALVHESKYDEFVDKAIKHTKNLFGELSSKNLNHIVNDRALKRLNELVETTKGEIVYQHGSIDYQERYFPFTLIKDVDFTDSTMKDEIFGPILPIIKYSNLKTTIDLVITHHDTPLSLILFTTDKKEQQYISSRIRSGGLNINEGMIHVGIPSLPFGGVGSSGHGSYHSKHGIDAFSHQRSFINQPFWLEPLFAVKYDAVTKPVLPIINWLQTPKVSFGRTGQVGGKYRGLWKRCIIVGIIGLILGFFSTD